MQRYVHLVTLRNRDIGDFDEDYDPADDLEELNELAEELGGWFHEGLMTLGQYDFVVFTEFPDDETAAQFVVLLSRSGARAQTLRGFTQDEFRNIVRGVNEHD